MSDLLSIMQADGWDDYEPPENVTPENERDIEIELENTTGLASKYLDLPLRDFVRIKGGVSDIKDWTQVLRNLTAVQLSEQKILQERNELIDKDFMISNVLEYLQIFMKGVIELAESQTAIIISTVQADPEEAKHKITELRKKSYTKLSREAKKSIKDAVKRRNKKYDINKDS